MTSLDNEGIEQPSRATFLRQIVTGSGALVGLAAIATQTGCQSATKSIVKGAVEGAGEGADEWAKQHPGEKQKLEKIVDDVGAITSSGRVTAQQIEEATKQVNDLLKRNEKDLDKAIQAVGQAGELIRKINAALDGLREIFDKYRNAADDLLNALVYFLRRLALKVGAALAELIAYFVYLLFLREVERLIDELRRRYWFFNVLGTIV